MFGKFIKLTSLLCYAMSYYHGMFYTGKISGNINVKSGFNVPAGMPYFKLMSWWKPDCLA